MLSHWLRISHSTVIVCMDYCLRFYDLDRMPYITSHLKMKYCNACIAILHLKIRFFKSHQEKPLRVGKNSEIIWRSRRKILTSLFVRYGKTVLTDKIHMT